MTASALKELYNSPNGDRWLLSTDATGKRVVVHHPNQASGGRSSQLSVEEFLSVGARGPEHHALVEALASLEGAEAVAPQQELPVEVTDRLARALGQAVGRCWSRLPQDIQHELFEAAVTAEGETIRQQLALYLHRRHERTVDAAQSKAMPTPDSLGG